MAANEIEHVREDFYEKLHFHSSLKSPLHTAHTTMTMRDLKISQSWLAASLRGHVDNLNWAGANVIILEGLFILGATSRTIAMRTRNWFFINDVLSSLYFRLTENARSTHERETRPLGVEEWLNFSEWNNSNSDKVEKWTDLMICSICNKQQPARAINIVYRKFIYTISCEHSNCTFNYRYQEFWFKRNAQWCI